MTGFSGGSAVENPPANAEDTGEVGSVPQLGSYPEAGNDNPLQYSCLENSMDGGSMGHKELDTAEHTHHHSVL